ncbi:hypothetical protein NONO_c51850 [Nocardia nova SH22a]|uniref:Mce-associated membrane protein n=1 Tax=Nocardia nova SH22a TaxID=1415166 RepID=W5TLG1_9NOCA|nr:hypothetical protein [Nocardia nova]AHH19969.1 hypothetical protein NONO_c51850 [Nocardia nova SH22a]
MTTPDLEETATPRQESAADEHGAGERTAASRPEAPPSRASRTVSISLSTVLRAGTCAVLLVALAVSTAAWWSARGDLRAEHAAGAARDHAQRVAMDYAIGASNIDDADFNGWVGRLKANTTPQLANKFDATAPKLQQILAPLKWKSSARPIATTIASESGGVYKVNAFIGVNSTSAQSPDGGQTTVTYTVTVDSGDDWKVSDVGGLDGALPVK